MSKNETATPVPAQWPDHRIAYLLRAALQGLQSMRAHLPDNDVRECVDVAIGALLAAQRSLTA